MRVPASHIERDESHAGLDQPPGEQGVLPPLVAAVTLAQLRVFFAHVKGFLHLRRSHHVPCLLGERVHALDQAGTVDIAPQAVETLEHAHPLLKLLQADAARQSQVADVEAFVVGIVVRFERIVGHSQIGCRRTARAAGQRHISRKTGHARTPLLAHDAAVAGHFVGRDIVRRRIAGEQKVRRRLVPGVGMRHRANDRQPIDHFGAVRQVFGDLIAGQDRGHRIETAAKLGRSLGLQIPHVEMTGTPALPDQDHAQILAALGAVGPGASAAANPADPGCPSDSAPTFSRLRRERPSQQR